MTTQVSCPHSIIITSLQKQQQQQDQAKENVAFNEVDPNIVKPQQGDATSVLYNSREKGKQFDVIDLDPYGTAAPFLDGAVQAVKNGGLLCITCTDMRVLSGGQADLCYGRYAAMPMVSIYFACHLHTHTHISGELYSIILSMYVIISLTSSNSMNFFFNFSPPSKL
jgi:tRNA G26 N,N-dimethylase Trm1